MNRHARASHPFAVVLLLATTLPLSAQELKLRATLTHELWGDRDSHLAVSVAFSGDGKMLASAGRWTVKLWDVATGKEKATLRDGSGFIQTVALSSDGKLLASAGYGKTIWLWDVATQVKVQIKRDEQKRLALEGMARKDKEKVN